MITSVSALIDELGGSAAVARLAGVSTPAVSNWKVKGVIPSEYFLRFSEELERGGKAEPDRNLFGFKPTVEVS